MISLANTSEEKVPCNALELYMFSFYVRIYPLFALCLNRNSLLREESLVLSSRFLINELGHAVCIFVFEKAEPAYQVEPFSVANYAFLC